MNQKFFLLLVSLLYFPNDVFAKEVEGRYFTNIPGVIFKNVKCVDNNWKFTLINTNTNYVSMSLLFYTEDEDGDPLETFSEPFLTMKPKTRRDVRLTVFPCSVPLNSIKYTIEEL